MNTLSAEGAPLYFVSIRLRLRFLEAEVWKIKRFLVPLDHRSGCRRSSARGSFYGAVPDLATPYLSFATASLRVGAQLADNMQQLAVWRPAEMLSFKARYGLRALVELARAGGEQLTAADLATRADAPRKFLEVILLALSRAGIITSRRGKFGGYVLSRPAAEISFAQIIRIIDGPLALAPCVSRTAFRKCDDCPDLATCSLREALLRARDATSDVLDIYSLADASISAGAEIPSQIRGARP